MIPQKICTGRAAVHLGLMCLIMLLGIAPHASFAALIYVDDNTCPAQGSGTETDPFCSIDDAISAASPGDDVLVRPGSYAERIYMKTGVDVVAADTEKPVITPSNKTLVKFEESDNCKLDGFMLDASGWGQHKAIILIEDTCTNVTISNCEIKGADNPGESNFRTGIRLNGTVSVNIIDNTIYNTSFAGITTKWGGTITNSTVTIQGNTIEGNERAGIYLDGAAGSTNRVIIGGNGVNDGNLILNNGSGSTDRGSGIRLARISQASIENNTIYNNRRAGILLIDTSSVSPHIAANSIHDNGESGINIGGASNLTIGDDNTIYNNSISGITFYVFRNPMLSGLPSSRPVLITGNSIYGNAKAGVAVIDHVTGTITMDNNEIHENTRSGIAFFNACTAVITDNHIYSHTGAAGIFTGDWSGTYPPDPENPPSHVRFLRGNGPADLTIRRNRIHDNHVGMRLDHASGVITNNLVYNNSRSGIRYSGDNSAPYAPFNTPWGITEIINNTVVNNGSHVSADDNRGGGIVYDDINTTVDEETGLARNFYDHPVRDDTQGPVTIKNNIAAWNIMAGIRDAVCGAPRAYNLYYNNNGRLTFVPAQTGGCFHGDPPDFTGNTGEIFADPLFVDRTGEDFHLQPGSPAGNSGDDGTDMGAYGGSDPLTL